MKSLVSRAIVTSVLSGLTLTAHAAPQTVGEIASTIHTDVEAYAKDVIRGTNRQAEYRQQTLSRLVRQLKEVAAKNTALLEEVSKLDQTLIETKKLLILRNFLMHELGSMPSADELLKTYFELQALDQF